MRIAPLVPIVGFALAMSASPDAQSGASAEVTFAKDVAPILQRSCQHCHNASGVAPMPLTTYEEVRPWSRAIKTQDRARGSRGRHAAVVRRKEHRHPEFQGRSIAERRGDRHDREVGRQRRAARQPRRHAAAARFREPRQVDDRRAGPRAAVAGNRRARVRSRQVGIARDRADRAHRGSLRFRGRSSRDQRHSEERTDQYRRRPLRLAPHDVFERGPRCVRGRGSWHRGSGQCRWRNELADSRSGTQRRRLPARSRPAAGGEFVARL